MDSKLLLLLAWDALLMELDGDYEAVPEEQVQLVKSKVYEYYGLKVTSSKEDVVNVNNLLIQDIKKYRDQIFKDIN